MVAREYHLHLLSDATGETLNAVAKAASAQFDNVSPREHIYSLVRTERQLRVALDNIAANPGVVLYTVVNQALRKMLERECVRLGVPHVAALDGAVGVLDTFLSFDGVPADLRPLKDVPSAFEFALNDKGAISTALSPVNQPSFPFAGGSADHADRLETCRALANDVAETLSARIYQARSEYLGEVRKYLNRLPTGPGTGNILLADAAARNLRNLFAADGSELSPGFASSLKTFLESHIALRAFYPGIANFYRDVKTGHLAGPLPLDVVEGFVKVVRANTPTIFDGSVARALSDSSERTQDPPIAAPDLRPSVSDQLIPPPDPLGELDPKKSAEFTTAGVMNALWNVFLTGEKVHKAVDGWAQAGETLRPYVRQLLTWLRSFGL